MPNPDSLDDEEEEFEEGNLPSLDPALDNKYYGFLNVPRYYSVCFSSARDIPTKVGAEHDLDPHRTAEQSDGIRHGFGYTEPRYRLFAQWPSEF